MHIPTIVDVAEFIHSIDILPRVEHDHIVISNHYSCTVIFFTSETVDHLVVHSALRAHLPAESREVAARAATWSNAKFVGLTCLLERTSDDPDDQSVAIALRASLPITAGVTEHQLHSFVERALAQTQDATEQLMFQFPTLGATIEDDDTLDRDSQYALSLPNKTLPNTLSPTTWAAESRQLEQLLVLDPDLNQVTPKRIEQILKRYGPRNLEHQIHDTHLLTKLGGLFVSFTLTTAPEPDQHSDALVIQADWVPELHPEEHFIPMVALCSVWNQTAATTKAHCHIDAGEKIHVKVSYSISLRYGLGEAQLINTLRVAIANTLAAIEHISTEATGASAVRWPL